MVQVPTGIAWAEGESSHDDGEHRGGGNWRGYQRHAFERGDHDRRRDRRDFRRGLPWMAAPVESGWFQRPYPYHLDYYRMRYGGSYAPYFGNLYGPPQVVTAPPYYGPYYGGYGGEYGNGYGQPGPAIYPGVQSATEDSAATKKSESQMKDEGLPAPAP